MKTVSSAEDLRCRLSEENLTMPYSDDLSILKTEVNLKKLTVPNRLVCQAMEGCDGTLTGEPDTLTDRRYLRLSAGGAGLIWFEATAVMKEARANKRQLYIHAGNLDAFKRTVESIRENGVKNNGYAPVVICQLTHSGRYSKPDGTPQPLIACHNPLYEKSNPIDDSRIVTDDYIDRVGEKLVEGARLAELAGFDGADIKCCHRYLNSELLSAYHREGKYGGTFENRTRLLRESILGAKQNTGNGFLVTSRLNVYDGIPYPYGFGAKHDDSGEMDLSEAKQLVQMLYENGVELLNITMGNPYFNPHVNRPFANGAYTPPESAIRGVVRMLNGTKELKQAVPQIKLICSGLSYLGVTAPQVAAGYIKEGGFDFGGFGRQILAYPDFANDILNHGKMDKEKCCVACSKCTELMRAGSTPGCVVKDPVCYLPLYKKLTESVK